ncbi:hypothetical protein OGH69_14805 [Flavobacterium sp. MFBS3-15]|uniref:hypothetical protein n=1 Tax=Flavobacterium sp. MFBS3-15 TaxID=2989816 RepID=UPI002235D2BC|nr:hypothetical protein [Flavobacterium sp. MFBS3-15]MCW4470245.1 hypothetical protein [Flavobacterium sp. MFBS3-15]
MNEIIGKLPPLVDNFIGNILSYAVVLATVATITMTFLEMFKTILKWKLNFHKSRVRFWVGNQSQFEELLILTVANIDSANALFDQPTDKMMAQIQAATNVAIDYPDMYPHLYAFITGSPQSEAAARETGGSGYRDTNETPTDAQIWSSFILSKTKVSNNDISNPEFDLQLQAATKARARIDHFIARKLDALQTQLEYNWARKNQYLAVFACACLLMGLLLSLNVPILPAIGLSFFGGMMAPLAKDIVSALSGLKSK